MPQGPIIFLLSPLPPPVVNLLPMPNLKKKRKEKEVVYQNEPKQQKMAKGQEWASSMKSREDQHVAEV